MAPSSISFSPTSLQAKRCQPDRKKLPVFSPLPYSISEIRAAIPPEFFVFSTTRALITLARDLITTALFFYLALRIPSLHLPAPFDIYSPLIRAAAWLGYWWFQGLVLTGVWVIGHECGHGAFSPYAWLNDLVGYTLHTLLWTPYFSWKISHHRHHMNHASMERDEVYVPKTRTDLGLPSKEQEKEHGIDWDDYFGDTPIWTLMMLIRQQVLAFPAYLRKFPRLGFSLSSHFLFSDKCIRTARLSPIHKPFFAVFYPIQTRTTQCGHSIQHWHWEYGLPRQRCR